MQTEGLKKYAVSRKVSRCRVEARWGPSANNCITLIS